MCFSAGASFAASAALGGAGVAGMRKTKTKSELLFASIPLLFALQQFIEGLQWIAPKPSLWSTFLGYAFLFFAFILWPTFLPIAAYVLEKQKRNKQAIQLFVGLGIAVSTFLLGLMLTQTLTITVVDHHIFYDLNIPYLYAHYTVYTLVLFGGLILSSHPIVKYLGILLVVSSGFSAFFFLETFTSVWCFFAAILSPMVYFYFTKHKPGETK